MGDILILSHKGDAGCCGDRSSHRPSYRSSRDNLTHTFGLPLKSPIKSPLKLPRAQTVECKMLTDDAGRLVYEKISVKVDRQR